MLFSFIAICEQAVDRLVTSGYPKVIRNASWLYGTEGAFLLCVVEFFHRRGRDLLDRDIALGVDVAVSRYDSAGSKDDLSKWKIRVKGEVPLGYKGLKDTAYSRWPYAHDC